MDQILHAREHMPVYDVAGPRDAFPIVLVHGAAATRKMWVPQLVALSDEFRVIALDLPGHGTLREQPFRLKAAVQAVMESLRHQTHDRALIVGLSLGDMWRWRVLMIILRRSLDWCCPDAVLIIGALLSSFLGSIVPLSRPSFRKTDSAGCRQKHFEVGFQKHWSSLSSQQDSRGRWRHVPTVNWHPTTSLPCCTAFQVQPSSSMGKMTSRTGKGRQHC